MSKRRTLIFISVFILISLFLNFCTLFPAAEQDLALSASSAALYEPENKVFLYSKHAGCRLPMASTTKIMTALIAVEQMSLDEQIAAYRAKVANFETSIDLDADEFVVSTPAGETYRLPLGLSYKDIRKITRSTDDDLGVLRPILEPLGYGATLDRLEDAPVAFVYGVTTAYGTALAKVQDASVGE